MAKQVGKQWLIAELVALFAGMPLLLLLPVHPGLKVGAVFSGVAYVIILSIRSGDIPRKALYRWSVLPYWKPVLLRFIPLIAFTLLVMWFTGNAEKLFIVVRKSPQLWLGIMFVYSVFSVYPQEFLYRTFFFQRYEGLFANKWVLIGVNAVVFSMGHLMFQNWLVLGLTLVGGVIFGITYLRTRSLLFTCVEHAIYGLWLFTVGMGEMLAFPMPQ